MGTEALQRRRDAHRRAAVLRRGPREAAILGLPPIGAGLEEKRRYEEAFNERAAYRYRLHSGPDEDGSTRWQNPFAAGSLRSEGIPESMRNHRRGPLVKLAKGRPPSTLTVSAADLPLQQRGIAGTTAHAISMSRRNAVEGVNGNLKRNFTSVDRGYVRLFGTERIAFLFAFTLAGLNVMLARSFRRMTRSEAERARQPRSRTRRRTGTYSDILGDGSKAVRAERPAGRDPPTSRGLS